MPVEIIKCSECDFEAPYVTSDGKGRLTIDAAKQVQVCAFFKEQAKLNPSKPVSLDCPHFHEGLARPRRG